VLLSVGCCLVVCCVSSLSFVVGVGVGVLVVVVLGGNLVCALFVLLVSLLVVVGCWLVGGSCSCGCCWLLVVLLFVVLVLGVLAVRCCCCRCTCS